MAYFNYLLVICAGLGVWFTLRVMYSCHFGVAVYRAKSNRTSRTEKQAVSPTIGFFKKTGIKQYRQLPGYVGGIAGCQCSYYLSPVCAYAV